MLTWKGNDPGLQELLADLHHLPGYRVGQVSCAGRLSFSLWAQRLNKHIWNPARSMTSEGAAVGVKTGWTTERHSVKDEVFLWFEGSYSTCHKHKEKTMCGNTGSRENLFHSW